MLLHLSVGSRLWGRLRLMVVYIIFTNFISPLHVPPHSNKPKFISLKNVAPVKPEDFIKNTTNRLHALYAQLGWITPAPPVLPRLLARSLPGLLTLGTVIIFANERTLQSSPWIIHATLLDQAKLIVQNSSLQPVQFGPFSFPLWLIVLSDQLEITGLIRLLTLPTT